MNIIFTTERLERWAGWLWGLVLLTLPVTSFKYFPAALGRTVVKPLAFYPLALLWLVLLVMLWRGERLRFPGNSRPLLAFLLFALVASALGALLVPVELRGAGYLDRVLRAWISLGIGLAFFLAAFWMNRDEVDLRRSLKWLLAGLGLTLLWSFVQALAINTDFIRNVDVDAIQELFSERGTQARRVTGFAYEPAWLADQMVLYYMPWLFATLITGWHFFRRKWAEGLLFLLCGLVLLFTYSRSGLFGGVLTIGIVALLLGRAWLGRIWAWFTAGLRNGGGALVLRVGLVVILALGVLGAFAYLGRYQYFANLWEAERGQTLTNYLIDINIAQRVAYAEAGYGVFEAHPFSGVGLGASGLYLYSELPDWSLPIPEIARQLAPDSQVVPNPKNLYSRLLAETGLPGLWLFGAFMLSTLAIIRRQWRSKEAWLRYVGAAGLVVWVGLAIRNLTQDSLTFPIMWVSLGMIAGLGRDL